MPAKRISLSALFIAALLCALTACGGSDRSPAGLPEGLSSGPFASAEGLAALPHDGVQPWEQQDSRGFVIPASRASSSLNNASEFTAGVERFGEGGAVSDFGEASRLSSGSKGGGSLSYASYRIPMGGLQPGALALDVNLRPRTGGSSGEGSGYYVGLSDYAKGVWEWHGPYTDSQIRLGRREGSAPQPGLLASADYLSPLGNLFITLLAFDGADFDVVALGVNPIDAADTTAPPAPAAVSSFAMQGCIDLVWTPVIAADLAGYRLYLANNSFSSVSDPGVSALPFLHGSTRCIVPLVAPKHVRIAAVDISGNESPLSEETSVGPLPGAIPRLSLSTDIVSGLQNAAAQLSVSSDAGVLFDYDLNGDGDYEITDSAATVQSIDTSAPGVIRPAVRAVDSGSSAVAMGSVSLIISGNSRPVALATASPSSGTAPLSVNLNGEGEDSDGSIAEYAWDYTGDGIFDFTSSSSPAVVRNYTGAGVKNAKLRVTDDQGDWDVDSAVIVVEAGASSSPEASFVSSPPDCNLGETVFLDASESTAGSGSITKYEWDLNGDGLFEKDTGTNPTTTKTFSKVGHKELVLKITTSTNATDTFVLPLTVHGWSTPILVVPGGTQPQYSSLREVNGRPAIAIYDLGFDGGAYFVRAEDADGESWGSSVPVDTSGNCWFPDLEVVSGNPAICFYDNTVGQLKYCRALDPDGAAFGVPKLADPNSDRGPYCSMTIVNGRPAISYQDNGFKDLYYVRANDATGSSWGTPQPISTASITGLYTSLAVISGNPAIAFHDSSAHELRFVRALNADGSGAWGPELILDGDAVTIAGEYNNLMMLDGVPCIAYSYLATADLRFIRAFDSVGTVWGFIKPVDGATSAVGSYASMALVGGKPVISYLNGGGGYVAYVDCADSSGSNWNIPQYFPPAGSPKDMSVCEINGGAAISYVDANTSKVMYMKLY